ncbi:MAG: hypothetical protein COB09_16950 [Thalassobium sp.]|nr:MAG: hypothetical protein COB09_16950 [Thalassobium sp.]
MARKILDDHPFRLYLGKYGTYFTREDGDTNTREVTELSNEDVLKLLCEGHGAKDRAQGYIGQLNIMHDAFDSLHKENEALQKRLDESAIKGPMSPETE